MPSERNVTRVLFAVGAGLVIAAFAYSVLQGWPSFDPLASATLIGIGLLLVVIYERLGAILRTLERLLAAAEHDTTAPRDPARSAPPPDTASER